MNKIVTMINFKLYLKVLFPIVTMFLACNSNPQKMSKENLSPPIADKISYQHKIHDHIRVDNYYWMNQRDNPEVVDYLERENDYYQKMTAHTLSFQDQLYNEMRGRIKEDDNSVPYFLNGYWYITRYELNKDYPIYTRKKGALTAEEEILFDCNKMAEGHDYFRLVGISVSPDNTKVAFGVDTVSRRQYTIQVKDLLSEEILKTKIDNTTGGSVWAADNKSLFYNKKDPQTLRSEAVYKHDVSLPKQKDQLVFEEEDETFSVYVSKSKSQEYLFISSFSTLTSEHRFVKSNSPNDEFKIFQNRITGMEYSLDHFGDHFYIHTNYDGAKNFKVMQTNVDKTSIEHWQDLLPHREDTLIEDFDLFENYWLVNERENGLSKVRVIHWDGSSDYYLPMNDETYTLYISYNPEFKSDTFRYVYNSMTTPASVIEFNIINKETTVLKTQQVLGGKFDKDNYISKRLWAEARDGKKIPISIVYHKDTELSADTPILQYAYGSYGSTIDPSFSSTRLSLLDRGFAFAITHIRGGEYLGRQWYEEGKLLKKKNTFQDFVDCSNFLIEKKYTSANHLYAYGGSAGGLLMGAVINMAPELYNGVIAAVPFVDVVTTMLDETIPLTTSEFDEWGNPKEKVYYDYMLSYSPYDQIKPMNYPNLLVTSGFHDSQVQYFEPTKWVAKIRSMKTDKNLLFLDTNMKAGHSGASGRFDGLKELAKKFAFIIDLEEK
ncbi:MAG: oligopeptidase B [Gammaproteobacteria bacterium TMED119]|nr:MAG: oligopeptidase B [Gammaproteobacteria bacterium TMED119]